MCIRDRTFTLGRSPALDYPLLRDNVFAPLNRVVIAVQFNALTEVLIDGVVTEQQVASGSRPGEARLVVTGEDLSRMLDRRERSDTFPNQSDADIVRGILGAAEYAMLGLRPDVTTTRIRPNAVSYTHLDVYKRQDWGRARTRFRLPISSSSTPTSICLPAPGRRLRAGPRCTFRTNCAMKPPRCV